MRVLHLVKTSDGARWAMEQVRELVALGHEVAVVLPSEQGKMIPFWRQTSASLYFGEVDFPARAPWLWRQRKINLLEIVEDFQPDLIHSHFFGTTITARAALRSNPLPVAFQIPGPLHMENGFFRQWDLKSARAQDFWIASSRAIRQLYLDADIEPARVGMSYYGNKLQDYDLKGPNLREKIGAGANDFVAGNISYFYPPKSYLFQTKGLKGHELAFKAFELARGESNLKGVFWGCQWGGGNSYENKLNALAPSNCAMPGALKPFEVSQGWLSLNLCVHVPFSENCGGVVEPLLHEVPVLAANVGGLPEMIHHKKTGLLVSRDSEEVKTALLWAKRHPDEIKLMAEKGRALVASAFDVERSSREIAAIYRGPEGLLEKNHFIAEERV